MVIVNQVSHLLCKLKLWLCLFRFCSSLALFSLSKSSSRAAISMSRGTDGPSMGVEVGGSGAFLFFLTFGVDLGECVYKQAYNPFTLFRKLYLPHCG